MLLKVQHIPQVKYDYSKLRFSTAQKYFDNFSNYLNLNF